MPTPLRVLILEDRPDDAELLLHALSRAGFEPSWEQVATEPDYLARLDPSIDIILSDFSMPQFDAIRALQLLHERGLDIPFILVSGTIGEEMAVAAIRHGAADYLLKDRLTRLGPAVSQALEQRRLRWEMQQAEQRFRTLIENSADGITVVDAKGTTLYVSPSIERILGYSQAEALGREAINYVYPEDRWHLMRQLARRAKKSDSVVVQYRFKHKDGSWRWLESTVSHQLDEPTVQGIIFNYRDITERKQAEAQLAARNEEIKAISQQLWQAAKLATMGELAASVAHELNNPLATVSLRVESLLAQAPEGDPRRRALEVIEQEVERMGGLVSNLLNFSRRSQPQISTVDVREEITNALEFVQYHLRRHQIAVTQEFAPDAPMVPADRQQLRQLFLNLLTNATDAMPQGGGLTVRVSRGVLNNGAAALIEFGDTGAGIAPENLERVWEPFFTTKPEGKGTGLGLAICRRIVEEHGGTIDITSAVNQGTTVRIALPSTRDK